MAPSYRLIALVCLPFFQLDWSGKSLQVYVGAEQTGETLFYSLPNSGSTNVWETFYSVGSVFPEPTLEPKPSQKSQAAISDNSVPTGEFSY